MEQFGLSKGGTRLFDVITKLVKVEKDDFLMECTDPCLLEIPLEGDAKPGERGVTQAFGDLLSDPSAMVSTVKVDMKALENLRRSKQVDRARIHLLAFSQGGSSLTLGRAEECDVVLDAAGVSRTHAEVKQVAGQWLLTDLGSNNGTFVNGKQMAADTPLALKDRQSVWFATYRSVFLYPESVYDLAMKLRKGR